jgi:hypothetical protein
MDMGINLVDRVIWSDRFWSKTFEYKGNIHDRLLTISWDRKISDFYLSFLLNNSLYIWVKCQN